MTRPRGTGMSAAMALLPQFVLAAAFILVPAYGLVTAGLDVIGDGARLTAALTAEGWLESVLFTFWFAPAVGLGAFALALAVALALDTLTRSGRPGAGPARVLIAAMLAAPPAAIAAIAATALLGPQNGAADRIAIDLAVALWALTAIDALVLAAAMGRIPQAQLDAASLDAVTFRERFELAIWPAISPMVELLGVFNLVFALVASHAIIDMTARATAIATGPQSLAHRMANAAPGTDADAAALAGLALALVLAIGLYLAAGRVLRERRAG